MDIDAIVEVHNTPDVTGSEDVVAIPTITVDAHGKVDNQDDESIKIKPYISVNT